MSFSPSIKRRQDMFKTKGPDSPLNSPLNKQTDLNDSPTWRNVYKKRCFDEFKKSRQKLMNKFRDLQISGVPKNTKLKDYLEDELNKICLLEANIESLPLETALEMYQLMQNELIPNEYSDEQLLEYYEYDQMNEHINNELLNRDETIIVCPLCQKSNLNESNEHHIIKCNKCSFSFSTFLNLVQLSAKLNNALHQHTCLNKPNFQCKDCKDQNDLILMKQLGINSGTSILVMSCDACNFMEFIF